MPNHDHACSKRVFIKQKRNGFTLMEMLVSLGIILLLSVFVAVRFSGLSSNSGLDATTEELASTLRQAQLWALTGQTRSGVRPPGGWGVRLQECTAGSCVYFIFADLWPQLNPNHVYDTGNDEKIIDIVVDDTITVTTLNPVSGSMLDVVFQIPLADVYFNDSQTAAEATIELTHTVSGNTRLIRIDQVTGRINVE